MRWRSARRLQGASTFGNICSTLVQPRETTVDGDRHQQVAGVEGSVVGDELSQHPPQAFQHIHLRSHTHTHTHTQFTVSYTDYIPLNASWVDCAPFMISMAPAQSCESSVYFSTVAHAHILKPAGCICAYVQSL